MRRNLLVVLALAAALSVGVTAIAAAKFTVARVGNLIVKFDGGVSPKKLPKRKLAPVAVNIRGQLRNADGTHPPAFREAIVDLDKNGAINTRGLPVCKGGQLQARDTKAAKRVCGKSIVGEGSANVQIAFPEQRPIPVKSPLLLFNGGTKGNKTTMFIHSFITVPTPAAIVTSVTIKKVKKGRYGFNTVSKIPRIAGGSGSVLDFQFKVKKTFKFKRRKQSYLSARCADGKFLAKVLKAKFDQGPLVKNIQVISPCTPRG